LGFRQRHGIALTELVIVFALGLTGLIISRPWFVIGFNALDPFVSLTLWYVALMLWIYMITLIIQLLARGPISITAGKIGGIRGVGLTEAIGIGIFTFAFFIVWNFLESGYTTDILHVPPVPSLFLATEDGVCYIFFRQWLNLPIEYAAIMTYVFAPMALALLAASLITTKHYLMALRLAAR